MFRVFTCLGITTGARLACRARLFRRKHRCRQYLSSGGARNDGRALIWIAIAGAAIGYGIWATHFIAMLAYEPGVPTGYGISLTALSLAAAMILTSGAFGFAANDPGRWRAPIGGGIMGAGIASMHYLGMWALDVPGRMTWSLDLVVSVDRPRDALWLSALTIAVRHDGIREHSSRRSS